MSRAFADIVFTPSVLKEQEKRGGGGRYNERFMVEDEERVDAVGPEQAAFIARMDSFYQSTITETGWPYTQYRGGPEGFLKILDEKTLAYSDYAGNRQHVTAGNINVDDRMSILMVDHRSPKRLKVWGRARISDDPDLIAKVHDKGYRARPVRAIVVDVEALDWNCPSHIPQRITAEEHNAVVARLTEELEALRVAQTEPTRRE